MALIAYRGDHPEVSVFGLTFRGSAAVEVAEDSHAYRKLSRNADFEVLPVETKREHLAPVEVPDTAFVPEPEATAVLDAPKRRGRPPKAR